MFILRKNDRIGIGADACAQISEGHVRPLLAGNPEIDGEGGPAALEHGAPEAELIAYFERTGLHGERPRRRSRLSRLVDDPDPHTQVSEPQGENEACRSGPDDQHVSFSVRRYPHSSCKTVQPCAEDYVRARAYSTSLRSGPSR